MKVFYINSDGGGFADTIEITQSQTVKAFFAERLPHAKPQDYLIRVNRLPTSADQVLHEQDRISISPTKIQGACQAA